MEGRKMENADKPKIPHKRTLDRTNSGLNNWEDQCLLVYIVDSEEPQNSWLWKKDQK